MELRTLAENFGILIDAPNGVPQLRRIILELAIRGRLVAQEVTDEPIQFLLERVQTQRANSATSSREYQNLTVGIQYKGEIPFELPGGWCWVNTGVTGRIFNGNSVSESGKRELAKISSGLPFIATKDVSYGNSPLNYHNGLRVTEGDSRFKVAHSGAILICAEGGSAGKKMGQTTQDICFGNKLFANETWEGIDPSYVLIFYQSPTFYDEFAKRMTGIIGGIARSQFLSLPIPLPSTQEQHRIVAKVHHLMALCDQLEQKKEKVSKARIKLNTVSLDSLVASQNAEEFEENWGRVRSSFDHLLTTSSSIDELELALKDLAVTGRLTQQSAEDVNAVDLLSQIKQQQSQEILKKVDVQITIEDCLQTLPRTWEWAPLSRLITYGPKNGYSPRPVSFPTETRALTLSATTAGEFNPIYFKYVDEKIPDDSPYWLNDGDVLFQRGNSLEYVGVSAVYKGPSREFIYPDLMMKVRFSELLNLDYLALTLNSSYCRQFLRDQASGTSSSMPKINQGSLLRLPIPIPPAAEQARIVEKMTLLSQLIQSLREKTVRIDRIRSLLSYVVYAHATKGKITIEANPSVSYDHPTPEVELLQGAL